VRGQGPFNVNLVVDTLASLAGLGDPDNFSLSGLAVDLVVDDFGSIGGRNDGYDDVAIVIDGTPGQLAVFINDGTGDLVQQAVYNTGNEPSAVTSGDLDDDGTIDLAVTNAADDTIMTWSNPSADPTALVFDGSVGTGDNPSDIISLDIDNDLDDDLVVTCAGDSVPDVNGNFYGEIRFYETTSVSARTTLQLAQNLDSGGAPSGIKPGDVDPGGDKDEDVLIGFGATNTVGQGRNTSAALGGVAWSIIGDFPVGASPSEPQPADLDGDGFLDVFVSNLDGSSISLLRGTGSGAYDPAITTVLPSAPTSMTLLDHDLDGDLDLAMILENEDGEREIRVYRNDTLAGESLLLTLTDALDTGLNPILVGHGDLDADGYDDLVSINQEVSARGSGWLLKVRSGDDGNVACEGDTDGSGTVDVIDLLAVISAWGPCSGCNEDIDGNDAVDVLDLLAVISAWGECP